MNKELDVIELLRKLKRFLKKRFLRLLIISVIITFAVVFISHFFYSSHVINLTIQSPIMPQKAVANIINNLNSSLKVDDVNNNSSKDSDIPIEIIKGIKSIQATEFEETATELSRIDIEIKRKSSSNINSKLLISSFLLYLKNQEYIYKNHILELYTKKELLIKLDKKINELDSLQKKQYSLLSEKTLVLNTGNSYSELINLYENKLKTQKLIEEIKDSPVIILSSSISPTFRFSVFKIFNLFVLSIVLSFFIILLIDFNKKL